MPIIIIIMAIAAIASLFPDGKRRGRPSWERPSYHSARGWFYIVVFLLLVYCLRPHH